MTILQSSQTQTLLSLNNEKEFLRAQVTDLLNRLQSEDFKTYAALTATPVAAFEAQTQNLKTDFAELQALSQANGLGLPIYDDQSDDDELRETLVEFGIE